MDGEYSISKSSSFNGDDEYIKKERYGRGNTIYFNNAYWFLDIPDPVRIMQIPNADPKKLLEKLNFDEKQ